MVSYMTPQLMLRISHSLYMQTISENKESLWLLHALYENTAVSCYMTI